TADWISSTSSLVAAIVALLTLITVYLASIQILTRRQVYRLGLSKKSLGPWKSIVVSPSALRMQTQIRTLTLSVRLLVSKGWEPKISNPVSFELGLKGTEVDLEAGTQASWVNFLEGLGVSPEDDGDFYEIRYESELVNGIVPMHWKGRDLAAICSILGFQSTEGRPNTEKLMELPTQWRGPLGWLQFRASLDGCIVEYRRGSVIKDQLSREFHRYYIENLGVESRPFKLKSRLWQSISGMCLSDNQVISLSERCKWAEEMSDREGRVGQSMDEIGNEPMECGKELTDEEIREIMFGRNTKKMVVLYPSGGHLWVSTEGELVHSRGLEIPPDGLHEYSYIYTDEDWVGNGYRHKLGRLCMDMNLLKLMKEAVLQIEPDGFCFSPSRLLSFLVTRVWSHASLISERCPDQQCIFPIDRLEFSAGEEAKKRASGEELYHAIKLINNFKSTSRAMFTTADMELVSKASVSLRRLIGSKGKDLIWAILASPDIFDCLFDLVTHTAMEDLLDSRLACESGRFNLIPPALGGIKVELVKDGIFEGIQVVAALMDVFLNFLWIDRSWVTDVALYDTTMPQSVTMC
ncbi:hypothetical protein B9Z19DRAFT_922272, partial [Tuber borchii]